MPRRAAGWIVLVLTHRLGCIVRCGDQGKTREARYIGGSNHGDQAAGAVTNQRDAARINRICASVRAISNKKDGSGRVFHLMCVTVIAGASPRPAVMQRQHTPASAADRQRKTEISREARKTVQVNHHGMGGDTGSPEVHAINLHTASWDLHRSPGGPGIGNRLRVCRPKREHGENRNGR